MEDEAILLNLLGTIFQWNLIYKDTDLYGDTNSQDIAPGTVDEELALGTMHCTTPNQVGTTNWRQGYHYPFSIMGTRLYSRHPIEIRNWLSIVRVFRMWVWISMSFSLLIMVMVSYVVLKCYTGVPKPHILIQMRQKNSDLLDISFKLLSSLTEPDAYPWFTTNAISGSILITSWSLGILILNLSYNSMLRSNLIKPTMEGQINSVNDALNRGAKIYIVSTFLYDKDGNRLDKIEEWNFHLLDPRLMEFARKKGTVRGIELHNPIEDDVMEDILDKGASIIFSQNLYIQQAVKRPAIYSRIRMSSDVIMQAYNWRIFFIRRFLPWIEDFDLAIMKLQENGLSQKAFSPYFLFDIQRNPNLINSDEDHPLTLSHLRTVFLFEICGIIFAVIIFIGERLKVH